MPLCSISPAAPFILSCFFTIAFAIHNPAGDISINCGSAENFSAKDGREWIGDKHAKISSFVRIKGSSSGSTIISADQAQYKTARISRSQFSFEFRLSPGPKCIRLHFNPVLYSGFNGFSDLFTVKAVPFILLSNFSASITAAALGVKYFAKEFCLSLEENLPFNIIFYPDQRIQSKDGTYAFINGIEIISLPPHLSFFHGGVQVVGSRSLFHLDDYKVAFEIVHRQNARSSDDFVNMFGMKATIPKQETNKISNITWKVSVDVGFRYLIRVHFSELGLKMAETTHTIFKILVNEIIADTNVDILKERIDHGLLQYKDYMTLIQGHKEEGRRHLLISLESSDGLVDRNGPIRGFEILKLNNFDNNLASPNPLPPARDLSSQALQNLLRVCGSKNIVIAATIVAISVVNIVVHKLRKIWEANRAEEERKPSARAQRLCRRFSLAEMQSATKDFNHEFLIGKGGFGKVYKGLLDSGQTTVAIKRLKYSSSQGAREFWTEIETLSELRHINIVTLIGYCNERMEMMLVYDYMTCGTLADHIYKLHADNVHSSSLSWKQRLNICIESGRGLDYLHTGHGIIHRDVKSSNILLDETFVAKVSDFGLAKPEDRSTLQSHVSTNVKGTYGYLDPYYFKTRELTRKSDVYAFGAVLLEVLCGRPVIDPKAEEDKCSLTIWARESISSGEVDKIMSLDLRGQISEDSLKAFVRVAESCLDDEPKKRPTMAQVVLQLEFALQRQDDPTSSIPKEIGVFDALSSNDGTMITKTSKVKLITSPPDRQIDGKMVNVESSSGEKVIRKLIDASVPGVISSQMASGNVTDSGSTTYPSSVPRTSRSESGMLQPSILKIFTFSNLKAATRNFCPDYILGEGSFGRVFKGWIDEHSLAASRPGSGMVIAVKSLNQERLWGDNEWLAEINILGRFHHPNIVKLIGYCLEGDHRVLVYEFMHNGSMENLLFRGCMSFSWSLRMKIALDAARGLAFLHSEKTEFVHRNFKPSNILLDSDYNAKLCDFWLAKDVPNGDNSYESTRMVNYGYACPEYIRTGRLTAKSDVFCFGVVLLEILTGLKAIDVKRPRGEQDLVEWAKPYLTNQSRILLVLDAGIEGQYALDQAIKAAKLARRCLQFKARSRPNMDEVVTALEKLQN